jgi:hypothetical protein
MAFFAESGFAEKMWQNHARIQMGNLEGLLPTYVHPLFTEPRLRCGFKVCLHQGCQNFLGTKTGKYTHLNVPMKLNNIPNAPKIYQKLT